MDHRKALLELAGAVDPRQAVSVPAGWLLEALQAVPASAAAPADLTVSDLCVRFRRKPSAVRAWLEAGKLPGAYKLNGRDWRVPAAVVETFCAKQAAGETGEVSAAVGDMDAGIRLRKRGTV